MPVAMITTLSAKNLPMSNVPNAMTGFVAGSFVGWHRMTAQPYSWLVGPLLQWRWCSFFKKTTVGICEWTHTIPILWLSCTELHNYGAFFLQSFSLFSLCPKESVDMSANSWMMSCWHANRTIWSSYFDGMSIRHLPTCHQHTNMSW